jgi:hypothetical protein
MWHIKGTKYSFFHVPKNAGTSIKRVLEPHALGLSAGGTHLLDKIERRFHSSFAKNTPLIYLSQHPRLIRRDCVTQGHISVGDVIQLHPEYLSDRSILAVVRDPIDRLLSYFRYVKKKRTHYRHSELKPMNFGEFVEHEVGEYGELKEGDQYSFLRGDLKLQRKILFQETLSRDFYVFCKSISLDMPSTLPIENSTKNDAHREYPNCIFKLVERDLEFIRELKNE